MVAFTTTLVSYCNFRNFQFFFLFVNVLLYVFFAHISFQVFMANQWRSKALRGREGPKLLLNHGSTVTWGPPFPSPPFPPPFPFLPPFPPLPQLSP